MLVTHKIKREYAKLDAVGKLKLRGTLIVREEKRRVAFNKNRSVKNGSDLQRTRDDLGYVRTQMRLENIQDPV